MKKTLSFLLIFLLLISIIGCGKKAKKPDTSSENTTSGIIHADDNESAADTQATDSDNASSNESASSNSDNSKNESTASGNNPSNQNADKNSSQSDNHQSNTTSENNQTEPLYKDIICQSIPEKIFQADTTL